MIYTFTVVTGCTDGIGRQYAIELAKHGLNIVLVSRTESKLVELSNEIGMAILVTLRKFQSMNFQSIPESTCKVKTKWIKADFSEGKPVIAHIQKELASVPNIGILGKRSQASFAGGNTRLILFSLISE
jgi:17beta-estradiol 17-dehydrogenase / very-long-chain 3-oxoacyl-CoA reductase